MKLKLLVDVKDELISSLLVDGFEMSCGYWIRKMEYNFPEGKGREDFEYPHCELPLTEDGSLSIWATGDPEEYKLDRAKIKSGLEVMAEKYPWHMKNMLNDNHDGETADVLIQCCVFDKIVYG